MLQSYMGGIAKLLKEIQSRIKTLEEKNHGTPDEGLNEVIEKHNVIEESISANTKAVKRLDTEIKSIVQDKNKKENNKNDIDEALKRLDDEVLKIKKGANKFETTNDTSKVSDKSKKEIRCRYFNYGFCKYKEKCRFIHQKEVCKTYVGGKCEDISCLKRHPRACKYFQGQTGCRRKEACEFSHDELVCGVATQEKANHFKCAGCKHDWQESQFVVKHDIKNMEIFFCLNCEDWIKDKSKVIDPEWSLFDQDGNLNYFV